MGKKTKKKKVKGASTATTTPQASSEHAFAVKASRGDYPGPDPLGPNHAPLCKACGLPEWAKVHGGDGIAPPPEAHEFESVERSDDTNLKKLGPNAVDLCHHCGLPEGHEIQEGPHKGHRIHA